MGEVLRRPPQDCQRAPPAFHPPVESHNHRHPWPLTPLLTQSVEVAGYRGRRLSTSKQAEATCSQQMDPPSAPRRLANVNARARGIPGVDEASPSWTLSVRALHPKGS